MKLYDKISMAVLSVLSAVFIFVLSFSTVICMSFCNPKFMIKVLEKHDYYSLIYTEYSDSLEDGIAIPAGVEEGILSSVISKDEMKQQINNIITTAYDNKADNSTGFAYDNIKQRFYDTMVVYFTGKGIELNAESEGDILYVATHCADECKGYSEMPFIYTIGNYANDFYKVFSVTALASGCLTAFLLVLLLITKKWRNSAPLWMGISLLTAGLMLGIAPIYVLLSKTITHLNIGVKSLYYFAVGYASDLLYLMILVAALLILIALIIAFVQFIYPVIRRKIKSKKQL